MCWWPWAKKNAFPWIERDIGLEFGQVGDAKG